MAILITQDKWMHDPPGIMDPDDREVLKEASFDEPAVVMNLEEAFTLMQKEEPDKFQQFKENEEKKAGIRLTMEDLIALVRAADERWKEFDALVRCMTLAQAKEVRHMRVDERRTWRAVARSCYERVLTGQWEWLDIWSPPSNQIAGMALCHHAASLLHEDFMKPPWN